MPRAFLRCLALAAASALFTPLSMAANPTPDDPYLWLEDVQGDKALAWVRERNAESRKQLQGHPRFEAMRDTFRAILDSKEKIPYVSRRGEHLYNFWRDATNPRGLWRRTTLAEYRKPDPAWETVIDLDALAKAENENWVWSGADCLGPDYRRCLVRVSRGGADAVVLREFDTATKKFVDDGFKLPEAKTNVEWLDKDTLYVGTDFGPGSMTDSGYPRLVKKWKRGQPLNAAETVFEARPKDVYAYASVDHTPGFERTVFVRATDFYNTELSLLSGGRPVVVDRPSDSEFSFWRDQLLVQLRSDWKIGDKTWPAGSLLVTDAKAYLAGERRFTALFAPTPTRSLAGFSTTRHAVLLNVLDNVAGRLEEWTRGAEASPRAASESASEAASGAAAGTVNGSAAGPSWKRREVNAPFPGTLSASALHDPQLKDDPLAESYLVTYTDFLTPDSLMLGHTGSDQRELLKARPAFFDAAGLKVEQRFARSKDGTRVPYFVVWPQGAKADGSNPTLLYGYGGFEVSQQPWYSAGFGTAWYRHGGVLVVANIRGGGEYGPAWHQAATKANKQKSYDDFAAVAEDLIASKITSPAHLGMQGGSNGGLLVGAVMLQRPELFKAVVCQVPLLDMRRYHKLLAGASWVAEYGNPDQPAEWAWLSVYSPYQNVKPGQKLPKVLFTTSTRDDRVHPGHARKMAARMLEMGHAPLYYENTEGGHAGAADNAQKADMMALEFAFLWQQLGR